MPEAFRISEFLQNELSRRNLASVDAVEAARWLADVGLLKDSATRPGKPLRDLLRAKMIEGQRQEPNARWFIDRIGADAAKPATPMEPRTVPNEIATHIPLVPESSSTFDEARQRYKAATVRCVLVAESPPAADSGRFFYFEQVSEGDSLFWETMKTLYPKDCPAYGPPRDRKREFLARFRDDGFYLLDAVAEPLGKASRSLKRQRIRESLPRLRQDLRGVCGPETKVILISAPVYEVCAAVLKAEGFSVLNSEMIDFPGSGRQREFREKFAKVLSML